MAHLLRRKSRYLFRFGSCPHLGGIPGLATLWDRESIFQYVYHQAPTVETGDGVTPQERVALPEGELELPAFWDTVRTLDQVVDVDYYIPGCPPTPKLIAGALNALLAGALPPRGSVLASARALCCECELNETKPEKPVLTDIKRVWEII